jgi:putative transcriptional regulator
MQLQAISGGNDMPMNFDKFFEIMKNSEINNGVTSYSLRKRKMVSESSLQRMRLGKPVTTELLSRLCYLLKCQPNDIMTYIPDENDIQFHNGEND